MSGEESEKAWWVYLVECGDGTLYCGIARDVEQRMRDHATPKGSRYVRSHGGVAQVLWRREAVSRSDAQSLEAWVKRQSRSTKMALACGQPVRNADISSRRRHPASRVEAGVPRSSRRVNEGCFEK